MMNQRTLQAAALLLIVGAIMVGGAYYWGTSTIVADSSPPVINEGATTHGPIAYLSGKPTLLLFIDENLGLESATAEIKTMGGPFGIGSTTLEIINMKLDQKMDSDTYKYKGTCTVQLAQNTKYTVIYKANDQADNSDTWTTEIQTVNLSGKVRVNGIEVKGPEDTIYTKSLELGIEVEITSGANTVSRIYGVVNGETLEFTRMPSGIYAVGYKLPKDGRYGFMIQVLDTSGTDTLLASFNIQLGAEYQLQLVILVAGALVAAVLWTYVSQEEKKKPRGGRGK